MLHQVDGAGLPGEGGFDEKWKNIVAVHYALLGTLALHPFGAPAVAAGKLLLLTRLRRPRHACLSPFTAGVLQVADPEVCRGFQGEGCARLGDTICRASSRSVYRTPHQEFSPEHARRQKQEQICQRLTSMRGDSYHLWECGGGGSCAILAANHRLQAYGVEGFSPSLEQLLGNLARKRHVVPHHEAEGVSQVLHNPQPLPRPACVTACQHGWKRLGFLCLNHQEVSPGSRRELGVHGYTGAIPLRTPGAGPPSTKTGQHAVERETVPGILGAHAASQRVPYSYDAARPGQLDRAARSHRGLSGTQIISRCVPEMPSMRTRRPVKLARTCSIV
jgi:hypothetical protein